MSTPLDSLPLAVLHRFLRSQMTCKLLVASIGGDHAHGYANPESPVELKGIHVEPTENLVGISHAPQAHNWVGELEGLKIDYSSVEIGPALQRLLKGDGSILERILAPRHLLGGEDLRRLQRAAQGVICRGFFAHYRAFARGVLKDHDEQPPRTMRQILNAYRHALTGVHLLRRGKIELDLPTLGRTYGLAELEKLAQAHCRNEELAGDEGSRWLNRMVKLHALLEEAFDASTLPVDPEHPVLVEELLLDMRRRFFDAMTVQR